MTSVIEVEKYIDIDMNKQQLANRIWASANNMRSKIDASEYKDYILGLIFYKFLSDTEVKFFTQTCEWEEEDLVELVENYEDKNMKYAIEECQEYIGFFIEYKYLFNTWLTDTSFSVATLSEALTNFERLMSKNFASVYEGIFKTLREGLSKLGDNPSAQTKALKNLIKLIKDIPTDGSQDYDVLGYVYEFLISNFAANAGKKAGEFYTPHEVAMVMSEIVAEHHKNKESLEIYDPTSGSGSLLITIGKAVSKHIQGKNKVKYYAQELKENTYNLTRMNLVMRGIIPQNIVTRCADTLEDDWPIHKEGSEIDMPLAVDAVVSNPPYSQHWDPTNKEMDARFAQYGLAPKTKADYAFLLHELHHLKHDGILTIVLPHGVLFRGKAPKMFAKDGTLLPIEEREEGQAEGKIRANLIEKNNIDAIIGLPANIFFGTGIPTLIMVLRKNRGDEGVLIIDASKGFVKDGKQNRLRACDVKKIADTYRERKDIPGYSRVVSRDEIRRNEYNLNIPRYVDGGEAAVKYDIYSTMFGGIPRTEIADLADYWTAFPSLQHDIFAPEADKPYSSVKADDVLSAIHHNSDVKAFKANFASAFADFKTMLHQRLIDHVEDVKELEESDKISADIFRRTAALPLVDKYMVYQILADRWQDIMGDIEIIQTEGFGACNVVEPKYKVKKDKNGVEQEVHDGEKGRIIPFELVQKIMLADELDSLNNLKNEKEAQENVLNEIMEELDADEQHSLLNDDNTKFSKPAVNSEWAIILNSISTPEIELINEYVLLPKKKDKLAFVSAHPSKVWGEMTPSKDGTYPKKETTAKINSLAAEVEFEHDSYEHKVKAAVQALALLAEIDKKVKTAESLLLQHTKETITSLNMKEINTLLDAKWIEPITSAIGIVPDTVVQTLADAVSALAEKYAVTYHDIERDLTSSQNTLADLVEQLTGDEFAIKGLTELIKG